MGGGPVGRARRAARQLAGALIGGVAIASGVGACAEPRALSDMPAAPRPAEKPPVPAGIARQVCDADCASRARCGDAASSPCDCGGVTDTTLLRADWIQTLVACLSRADCAPFDACEAEAYRAIGVAPLNWPPVVLQCLERGAECGGSSATCRRLAALTDDARVDAARCFQGSCDDSAACLRAFLARRVTPALPVWR